MAIVVAGLIMPLSQDAWFHEWSGYKLVWLSESLFDHCPILLLDKIKIGSLNNSSSLMCGSGLMVSKGLWLINGMIIRFRVRRCMS